MVFRRGLIGDSSWLWLMTVVVVLMTDCVCCKIKERRNWKISIWFFVLGVTQNQERRAGESWVKCGPRGSRSMTRARLTPAEYYQTCHKRKWRAQILSGSQDSDHDLSSPITKPGEISNSSSSREMPFIQKDAVWFWLQTCNQPLRYMLDAKLLQHIIQIIIIRECDRSIALWWFYVYM